MASSFVELEVPRGLPSFRCPVTGKVIFDADGFVECRSVGPFFRFYADSVGGSALAMSDSVPEAFRPVQKKLQQIFNRKWESQNAMIAACVEVMPKTSVVFEIFDLPAGGGNDGSYSTLRLTLLMQMNIRPTFA